LASAQGGAIAETDDTDRTATSSESATQPAANGGSAERVRSSALSHGAASAQKGVKDNSCFPHRRGSTSSAQTFASLLSCSVVDGVLSPSLYDTMTHLALNASALTLIGAAAWWRYTSIIRCSGNRRRTGIPAW
jgi:hypothetical protein